MADYNPDVRCFEALSTNNMKELQTKMQLIEEWVYNPQGNKRFEMEIESIGVRKELDRQIKKQYYQSGMFFNWSRSTPKCATEKTKKFKQ